MKRWTKADLLSLRPLYRRARWVTILKAFPGRTRAGIRAKAMELGFKRKVHTWSAWTTGEEATLRRLYPGSAWSTILTALPRHSRSAIEHRAGDMKLVRAVARRSKYRVVRELTGAREVAGIPREKIATALGCGAEQIARWERGQSAPHLPTFLAWVDALGLRIELNRA